MRETPDRMQWHVHEMRVCDQRQLEIERKEVTSDLKTHLISSVTSCALAESIVSSCISVSLASPFLAGTATPFPREMHSHCLRQPVLPFRSLYRSSFLPEIK